MSYSWGVARAQGGRKPTNVDPSGAINTGLFKQYSLQFLWMLELDRLNFFFFLGRRLEDFKPRVFLKKGINSLTSESFLGLRSIAVNSKLKIKTLKGLSQLCYFK